MAKREQRDVVVCLDRGSGKEIWAQDGAATFQDVQRQGAGPRSTPTYHQGKLYCLMPRGELLCLSAADGKRRCQSGVVNGSWVGVGSNSLR